MAKALSSAEEASCDAAMLRSGYAWAPTDDTDRTDFHNFVMLEVSITDREGFANTERMWPEVGRDCGNQV